MTQPTDLSRARDQKITSENSDFRNTANFRNVFPADSNVVSVSIVVVGVNNVAKKEKVSA